MKKTVKNVFSTMLAVVLIVALCAVPALAAFAYTPINGGTFTIYKDLVMPSTANVPSGSFTFTIATGTAVAGSAGQAPISAGIGTPTITSSVSFSPSDTTVAGVPGDSTETGSKYVRKPITVDFSGVTFDEPGIFRYVITEGGSIAGVTNDENPTRYLDVYVVDDESTNSLVIAKYALYTVENGTPTTKPDGYVNTYSTFDLTISKTVTGNQGSRDKYFKFHVEISGLPEGTVLDIDRSNCDATVASTTATLAAYIGEDNPGSLIANASGVAAGDFYLASSQSFEIIGIPAGADCEVTETPEDYLATYTVDSGSVQTGDSVSVDDIDATTVVAFTNRRSGTVPTGVALSIIPGLLVTQAAMGAMASVVALRKKDAE